MHNIVKIPLLLGSTPGTAGKKMLTTSHPELLSQDFISSAAYGPRNIDQIFNMIEIKELTNDLKNAFDLNLLLAKTIPEINQWKTRNTRNKHNIMDFKY